MTLETMALSPVEIPIGNDPLYVAVPGCEFIERDFDENQLWFPFMSGLVIISTREQSPPLKITLPNLSEYAIVSRDHRVMYVYEKGVEQLPLPFDEFQHLSSNEFSKLLHAEFPTWEKRSDGSLLRINHRITLEEQPGIVSMLKSLCSGRFRVGLDGMVFARYQDYAAARFLF